MHSRFVSVLLPCGLFVLPLIGSITAGPTYADVDDLKPGRWSGGVGVGFMGNTPDGAAEFALKGHADYFFTRNFRSVR